MSQFYGLEHRVICHTKRISENKHFRFVVDYCLSFVFLLLLLLLLLMAMFAEYMVASAPCTIPNTKIQLNRIESPKIVFQVICVIHHVVNHIAKASMDHLKPVLYDIVDTHTHTSTVPLCVLFRFFEHICKPSKWLQTSANTFWNLICDVHARSQMNVSSRWQKTSQEKNDQIENNKRSQPRSGRLDRMIKWTEHKKSPIIGQNSIVEIGVSIESVEYTIRSLTATRLTMLFEFRNSTKGIYLQMHYLACNDTTYMLVLFNGWHCLMVGTV